MIERLPRVIAERPVSGIGGPDHPIRRVTREIAFEGGAWTRERAEKVRAVFDGLAPTWHERERLGRLDPLRDALARGSIPTGGLCIEVGSGTGFATPLLARRFERVLAVDLSIEMLKRADPGTGLPVRGDGAGLPVPDASAAAIVLMNAFLFPDEVARVLAPDGVLVWVCSSGDTTPIYLSAEDVDAAVGPGWIGVASEAGGGTWSVHRRA
jgi:SAM-dependent methyltransferase